MSRCVVIARYQENVSWSKDLPCPFVIYDKSENPVPGSISLPNIGRETNTYLFHIVHHYHNLPDYLAFLQGWPWDHVRKPLVMERIKNSEGNFDTLGVRSYSAHERHIGQDFADHARNWHRKLFGKEMSDNAMYCRGACFFVSKRSIRHRSHSFWYKLLQISSDPDQHWSFGYAAERLWQTFFFGLDGLVEEGVEEFFDIL